MNEKFWIDFIERTSDDILANKSEKIFEWDYPRSLKWFIRGYTSAGYSVANYKLKKFNKNAYIHVNTELGLERKITYSQLYNLVCEVYGG
jgi:acetyl-CoA synthetase